MTLPITLPQRQAYAPNKARQNHGFLATFGDPGWGKAEGRGQKAEGKKEGKIPKFLWDKSFKTSAFCLLPSALKPFSVLITKIGQEPNHASNFRGIFKFHNSSSRFASLMTMMTLRN